MKQIKINGDGPTDKTYEVGIYFIRTRVARPVHPLGRQEAELYAAFRVLAWQVSQEGEDQREDSGCRRGVVDMTCTHLRDDIAERVDTKTAEGVRDPQAAVWDDITQQAREAAAKKCRSILANCVSFAEGLPSDDDDHTESSDE